MNTQTEKYLQKEYHLHYVDYRDSIDADLMAECLKTRDASPVWDRIMFDDDMTFAYELQNIRDAMTDDGLVDIFDEDEDEIRDYLYDHDTSDPVRDLCDNTVLRARVVQHSDYECWIPPYHGGGFTYDGAFREAVDMLCLNPKDVKNELQLWADCSGKWPDRPNRKPVVDLKAFSRCCRNMISFGAWGFFGSVKGEFLHRTGFNVGQENTIPKGTTCGWCNWWNGGGTLELIETIRDVSLKDLNRSITRYDKHSEVVFEIDEKGACNGYSIMPEVYGATYDSPIFS